MSKPALGGYLIAIGCIWLICAHRAEPQVMLGIVAGFLVLWACRRSRRRPVQAARPPIRQLTADEIAYQQQIEHIIAWYEDRGAR